MAEIKDLFLQTAGEGPLVVLLHGLLMNGESWQQSGLVAALSPHFRVAYPDLPGHGRSGNAAPVTAYSQRELAAGIIRVIDRLGYQKAHILGYSAGGWLATGLAEAYPQRLSSLIIGGWDIINGLPQGPNGALSFDDFMAFAREIAPALANQVTEENEASIRAFFSCLAKPQQVAERLKQNKVPTLFWAGREDPCYPAVAGWAANNAMPLLTAEGDHLASMLEPGVEIREKICRFLIDAESAATQKT